MSVSTVAVTGGNGKIGAAILEELSASGYEAVNLARGKQREDASDDYYTTDLLAAGEVYGSLQKSGAGAVIHMGTIPGPTSHPEHRTYESNVVSCQHVLEAAQGLGIERVCLPSSINALGAAHQGPPLSVDYLPVDEGHPRRPHDEYGISKHVVEVTADGYGRRDGPPRTISSLRYPWVATEAELRDEFVAADRTIDALHDAWEHAAADSLFGYLHIGDAARVARRTIEADFEGHEAFWAVAADTTAAAPTADLAAEFYPGAERRRPLDGHEGLIDVGKAERMLGWTPERSWRDLE